MPNSTYDRQNLPSDCPLGDRWTPKVEVIESPLIRIQKPKRLQRFLRLVQVYKFMFCNFFYHNSVSRI